VGLGLVIFVLSQFPVYLSNKKYILKSGAIGGFISGFETIEWIFWFAMFAAIALCTIK
jgi:hypothetical protein